MKTKIFLLTLFWGINFFPKVLHAQANLHDSLVNINLANYVGKPIDSILANLPASYDSLKIGPALTVTQGAKIVLIYNLVNSQHSFIVTISPCTNNFITKLNSQNLPFSQAWPLYLLKKETLGSVEIMAPDGSIINSIGN